MNNLVGKRIRVNTLTMHGKSATKIAYTGTLTELRGHLLYLSDVTLHHGGSRKFADQVFNTNALTFVGFEPCE